MYNPETQYSYPRIISPEIFQGDKLEQAIKDELEKRIFEYVSWDIDRLLFIEANQE
jgi:spore coat polysaccharide biosynthesis protein SpsF (cytidylyltransferase family)